MNVSILSQQHPVRITATSTSATCDNVTLPSSTLELTAQENLIRVGTLTCAVVVLHGPVMLAVDALSRRYTGLVTIRSNRGHLQLLHAVPIETYLLGVVEGEMDDAPPAAVRAQAVVSRTFAAAAQQSPRHADAQVCDLTHCQLYRGDAPKPPTPVIDAVKATGGKKLYLGNVTLQATHFHAACGGRTSASSAVFGGKWAGPGVSDFIGGRPACEQRSGFQWTFVEAPQSLAQSIKGLNASAPLHVLERDNAGRVLTLTAFGLRLSGTSFLSGVGQAYGWQKMPSARFSIEATDTTLRFVGQGVGHGVGLCQEGARARAKRGDSTDAILKHYFPEATVRE